MSFDESTYRVRWGDYFLPRITQINRGVAIRERRAETPGRAGDFSAGGIANAKKISVTGYQKWGPGDTRNAAFRALCASLREGEFKPLYLHERYGFEEVFYIAEVVALEPVEDAAFFNAFSYTATFALASPFAYDNNEQDLTLPVGGDVDLYYSFATAPGKLKIVVPCVNIPEGSGFVVTNSATGKETRLILPGSATGKTITIDAEAESITTNTGLDYTKYLTGVFPESVPFATNTVAFAAINSPSAAVPSFGDNRVIYRERYR